MNNKLENLTSVKNLSISKKLKKVLTDIFLGDIVLLVLERGART